jgi:hypothetical protein
MPLKILKKPLIPNSDTAIKTDKELELHPNSQPAGNNSPSTDLSNNDLQQQKANTSLVPQDVKIDVSKDQKEAERGQELEKKQTILSYSKQYKMLQNSLIDTVNSIRKTYPNRRDWAGDFMINSMKDVLETDFTANLNHSGNADLDINRYALALEIQKLKSQLIELCIEQLKKNGVDESTIRNQYKLYKTP